MHGLLIYFKGRLKQILACTEFFGNAKETISQPSLPRELEINPIFSESCLRHVYSHFWISTCCFVEVSVVLFANEIEKIDKMVIKTRIAMAVFFMVFLWLNFKIYIF